MPHFFLNKRLIILLVSIIILVSLIGFSLRDRENISRPEQFVKDVVGFGQSLISKPAYGVAGFLGNMQDLQNTYTENKKLKARLEGLAKLEKEISDLKSDNEELRNVLKKTDNLRDYTAIQATVIGRTPDRWYENIIINKGNKSGVKPDMAVQTAKGLIGKVISTSEMTATIELLSSENIKNRASAQIQGKKSIYGLINGYDQDKKMLLMKDLPIDQKIKKGQNVITSGLGGVFPKGLDIGKVKELEIDRYGLTQTAYVEPSADFYGFEHVMVIVPSMKNMEEVKKEGE
ncbi:rod shape-determining protein MreC [Lederbergia citrea]|uniref:Cell shape-determining protein MreC n=1 Tax=Lederbergia citrea TaxID=2833581 RepID=A0A942UJE2_9BACI|nr:rod shape-determining protein MreC [Lederbergia citrea]MBS4176196.1 rod shape-determining protein MreC [Lederbergia citrea]MBS4202756.1 rod shape-determining protein MreC [Lederbergia citrea]MBS4222576.1 rod shape-determining protein MreC [Lederbergia citrea]